MKSIVSIFLLFVLSSSTFSANGPPPVFLGHFWIALDQATYDALRTSSRVAALGAVKEQKVVAGDRAWSGFYWSARQTYMEFFGASALPEDTQLGECGIGLSVEVPGGVSLIAERLRSAFGDRVEVERQVRTTKTGDVPWYTSTHLKESQTTAVWVMELDPGYLAARHPESTVKEPLSRQQERSWDYTPEQTLDNVAGLTVALDQERASELATELERFGWSVNRKSDSFLAIGPKVKILIVRATTRSGIQQVELHLRRRVPKQRISLGHAQLLLTGNTGRLIFWQ